VTPDEITLTLPRQRPFFRIAHLVLGGLAVRLDLTFEHLEDLQLALAGLLDRPTGPGDVTVTVRVEQDAIRALVGPFKDETLRAELAHEGGQDDDLSLGRLLGAVVDGVDVRERDGGLWVELTKTVDGVSR
jgi:hypothetical protein